MKWKYFIPHDINEERVSSEDVFLLPEEGDDISLWVTITGKDYFEAMPRNEYMDELLQEIENEFKLKGYYIKGNELFVNKEDFSFDDLLYWTKVWLCSLGFDCDSMSKGTLNEFRRHEVVNALEKEFEKMVKNYSSNN